MQANTKNEEKRQKIEKALKINLKKRKIFLNKIKKKDK